MPLPLLLPFAVLALGGGPAPATAAPALAPTTPVATRPAPLAPDAPAGSTPAPRCVTPSAFAAARRYARTRPGLVSVAVMERGRMQSSGGGVPYRSASLVKAMLLLADLRRHAGAHAPLTGADRARLGAMIRHSDNVQATATFGLLGADRVRAVAHLAGMRGYRVGDHWGSSQLTASDQARLWAHLDHLLPPQYRGYGRRLLRTIVPGQTWGGAPVARRHGYRTMFKSGWLPQPGGWVVHQGLRLERGPCTVGVAVLTSGQPTMDAGVATIRGVVSRLLGGGGAGAARKST